MTISEVKRRIKKNERELRESYKVKELYIFGSYAKGAARKSSDVDVLVEFSSESITLFDFLDLKEFLEKILKTRVDLVTRDALKDWMLAEFERSAIRAA